MAIIIPIDKQFSYAFNYIPRKSRRRGGDIGILCKSWLLLWLVNPRQVRRIRIFKTKTIGKIIVIFLFYTTLALIRKKIVLET